MSLATEAAGRLETMKETKYAHEAHRGHYCFVDKERGIYKYDETGMIWNLLESTSPSSFDELKKTMQIHDDWEKPTPAQLHYFFQFRPSHPTEGSHWQRIRHVKDLKPGDILAWNSRAALVMEKPVQDGYGTGVYKVKIVDSRANPVHDEDSRIGDPRCVEDEHGHRTGMGTGFIALKEEGDGFYSVDVSPHPGKRCHFEVTGAVVARPL